jgi:peptidase inhibitor family I36
MHVKLLLTAALLGAAALTATPSHADAAGCGGGNFCLWENANRGGGLYFFSRNDPNLHNDRFNGSTRVGDNGTTAKNNGNGNDSSGLVDVLAYQNTNYRGPALCIPLGTEIHNLKVKGLPGDRDKGDSKASDEPDRTWNDDISSFRWVANC